MAINSITNITAVIMWETPLFTDGLPVQYYIIHHYRNDHINHLRNLYPAINHSIPRHRFGRLVEGETSDVMNFTTAMGGT